MDLSELGMNAREPRPPEHDLAMQLMRVVQGWLEAGGSPFIALVGLLRAQESLVFMMAQATREVTDE